MDVILKLNEKIAAEYLRFEKNGRSHEHNEYESFFVLSGEGKIISGEKTHEVKKGDLVTIPPKTPHWMEPEGDSAMEGLLWYHDQPLNAKS